jgi:hypothetical protein
MKREDYWHDEYEKAATELRRARAAFQLADSARAVALGELNSAERETSRLFSLRFSSPTLALTPQQGQGEAS